MAAGHSFWLRFFFRSFFPKSAIDKYDVRKKKLSNCGILSFEIERGIKQGRSIYRIDPESVKIIKGNFS